MPTEAEKDDWIKRAQKLQDDLRSLMDEVYMSDLPPQSFTNPMNKHNLGVQLASQLNMAESIKQIIRPPAPPKL